jgi:hypothetical protein
MAVPDIARIELHPSGGDRYAYSVWVREGSEIESFDVEVSDTQRVIAGFGNEGPSEGWVRERLNSLATGRLSNYEPVLPQMRAWASPIVLQAEPA